MLQIAVARENFFEIVAGVGHAMLELMHFVFNLLQPAKGGERGFVNSRSFVEMNVLGQQSEFQSARAHHLAAIGRLLQIYQSKDRGLARAVATDQPHMLARIDLE